MELRFTDRTELVPGIWHYSFVPARRIDFVPGQYVELQLEGVMDDPRGSKRTFSLTSLPSDPSMQFVVKHFELQSPYKHRLQALTFGDTASIGDAMGDLILPKLASQPLVFIAGGIGVSSYASMLQDLLSRQEERPIYFFYALRAKREQIFTELLNAYPLQAKEFIIAPNRLKAADIAASAPPESLLYISGSQKFVEGLRTDLSSLGFTNEQIIFDYYDGYIEL